MSAPPTVTECYPPLPLAEVAERVRRFPADSIDARRETIRRLVEGHAIICYDWGRDWRYRRARLLEPDERPNTVIELIWRADAPAKLGRVNPAGFGVLYLADRVDTVLSEVRAVDDDVVLTEFRIRAGRTIRLLPVGELTQVQRTGRGFLAGDASETITQLINACEPDACRSMLITDAFLLECLTNREDDYGLSSEVAMALFDKLPEVGAIAYPSRRRLGAMNFGVRVDRFWDSWGIISVRRARAIHLAMGYYDLKEICHVNGIMTSGELVWDEAPDDGPGGLLQLDPPWFPSADASVEAAE